MCVCGGDLFHNKKRLRLRSPRGCDTRLLLGDRRPWQLLKGNSENWLTGGGSHSMSFGWVKDLAEEFCSSGLAVNREQAQELEVRVRA